MSSGNQKPWVAILIAVITLMGTLGAAFITNGDRVLPVSSPDAIQKPESEAGAELPVKATPGAAGLPEPEPPPESSAPEPKRISIERATVEDENFYSSSYGPEKTVDNNIDFNNYWSTKAGSIIEVVLNFSFEAENTVSEIHFVSTRSGSSYTQPQSLELLFFDASDKEIATREVQLTPPKTEWERRGFDPVANVSRVQVELRDPLNDTASYMTLNEVQFYGYPSN